MNIETVYNRSQTRYTGDIVEGLNRVIDIRKTGFQMEHHVYTKAEIKANHLKKVVTLMHFPVQEKKPFALIIAGGAYQAVSSASEGFPTAVALNTKGYHAFSFNYRVGDKNPFPTQVEDLHTALQYIFDHADDLNVDTKDYAIVGYSAGGHLTASLLLKQFKLNNLPYPKCIGPNYPALKYIDNQFDITINEEETLEKQEIKNIQFIQEHLIDHPPLVCWYHCQDDLVLPISGSNKFDELLKKNNIKHKFLSYPTGGHGCGLATHTSAEGWLDQFVDFWQKQV